MQVLQTNNKNMYHVLISSEIIGIVYYFPKHGWSATPFHIWHDLGYNFYFKDKSSAVTFVVDYWNALGKQREKRLRGRVDVEIELLTESLLKLDCLRQ